MAFFLVGICVVLSASTSLGRIIDMTWTFNETTQQWPGAQPFEMEVVQNGTTEKGFWFQNDVYSGSVHAGTHMVAPAHVVPGGTTIDMIPVSSFIAPAAVVDITAKAESNPDAEVSIEDLLDWENITNRSLDGSVILIRRGWGRKWNNRTAYIGNPDDNANDLHYPGMGVDAARWLVADRKIIGIGIDTLTYDVGNNLEFTAHQILSSHGIFGLENVANMEQLPMYGATLYMMPMKIGQSSGAPVRIIATIPSLEEKEQ